MSATKILIVDGMALLFRAYFAQSYGSRPAADGTPTNAVYGFLQYLFDAINQFQPSHVVCCWDMDSRTFRTELYAAYKGNRGEPPEDLVPQFELVKQITAALAITNVGVHGYEADDCIGTLAKQFATAAHVYILTGDQDMLQLVAPQVHVIIMKKGRSNYAVYDATLLREEKGVHPAQIIDMKGLTGDTSDNYPGVKGIGEKTALKLLQQYETIEGILAHLHELTKAIRTKIENDIEMLHLSRRLATIHVEVPLQCRLEDCVWNVPYESAAAKLEPYRLHTLLKLLV